MLNFVNFIYLCEFNLIFIILIYSLKALSHIRREFVLSVFYSLEEEALALNIEIVNNFYKYFKNEYIDRLDYNCWNFYKIKKHLTNNPCEAYHNHLYKIIGKKTHFLVRNKYY